MGIHFSKSGLTLVMNQLHELNHYNGQSMVAVILKFWDFILKIITGCLMAIRLLEGISSFLVQFQIQVFFSL